MSIIDGKFVSFFKRNGVPILPPVITSQLREEIASIRAICREKEERLKQQKERLNLAIQEESRCGSANSYTISNPFFPISQLPEAPGGGKSAEEVSSDSKTEESDKETIVDGSLTMQSEILEEEEEEQPKTKKEENKLSKPSPDSTHSFDEPQIKHQLKELIDKQKEEYLRAMDLLKRKFATEQHSLLAQLQTQMQNLTSTPMANNSMMTEDNNTEDEEFVEFKSELQTSSGMGEKTLINETDRRIKAVTIINAHVRGYLVRRLMKTKYVQDRVKNILETVQYIRNIENHRSGSPILKNNLLKKKLFLYLQSDLYRVYDIFINYSTKEKMKMISTDRSSRQKAAAERNVDLLNYSIQTI